MSDHADTIRIVLDWPINRWSVGELADAKAALDSLVAENQRLRDALRYITGRDVAGYEPHMRPEEVARAALVGEDE